MKVHRWYVLAAAAAFYGLFIFRTSFRHEGALVFTLIDDAMISMRYARHVAAGDGFTWNVGEPAVQGFTNLGWTLMMAAAHRLGLPDVLVPLVVMLVSVLLLLILIRIVWDLCEALGSPGAAPLAAIVTAGYFPLVFWSLRGMEVGALAAVISAALLCAVRRQHGWVAALLAAAVLIRMDAALSCALIVAFVLFKEGPRAAAAPMLALGASVLAVDLWQWSYFGSAVPNTYHLKIAGVSAAERIYVGLGSLVTFSLRDFAAPLLLAAAGCWLYRDARNLSHAVLLALFAAQCAYSVWVGGDYTERYPYHGEVDAANRFVTQGMPFLIVLGSMMLTRVVSELRRPHPMFAPLAALGLLLAMSGPPWFNWVLHDAPILKADIQKVEVGLKIAATTPPGITIAVHGAGQIPYFSHRRTIDLLGKSDPVIAMGAPSGPFRPGHNKWNYDYSINQLKPDLVADEWNEAHAFLEGHPDYVRLDGMYFRRPLHAN